MIKRISIEGMDRTGKSTQIELLRKYLYNLNIFTKCYHFIGPEDKTIETQFKNFTNSLWTINNEKYLAICDRDIYGEFVYGLLYRKNNPNFIWQLEKIFKKLTNETILFLFEDEISNILDREDGKSDTLSYWGKVKEKILFRISFYLSKCKYKKIIKITNRSILVIQNELRDYIFNIMRKT